MAVYNFPTSPSINDTYLAPNGVTYIWDGEKWLGIVSSLNPDDFVIKSANTQQVINGDIGVNGNTTIGGELDTFGGGSFGNNVTVDGDANVSGDGNFGGGGSFGNNVTIDGDATVNGNINTTNIIANSATFTSANVDTLGANVVYVDRIFIQGLGEISANNININLDDLLDVDTTGVTNGQILTWDGTNWVAANNEHTVDTYVTSASFDTGNGELTLTRNDGNTIVANFDGRYLELADGGIVTGNTIFNGNLQTPTVPTANDDVTNKAYVDALVANGEVTINAFSFDLTNGNLVIQETNGTNWAVDLDGRYIETPAAATNGQVLTWDGTNWIAANTATNLADLGDVDLTGVANGSILYYDNATSTWKAIAGDFIDNFVNAVSFDATTGDLTVTRNDGNTYTANFDGRYFQMPNGTTAGQILSWDGASWVVANNDHTVDTFVNAAAWDAATDTLTLTRNDGNTVTVVIPGVDQYVNSASFDSANGELTLTMADGNTVVVDLDGRYLELTAGGTVTGNTIFNGNLQTPTVPTAGDDVTNKTYVDALVANSEVTINAFSFDINTGNLVIQETDGTNWAVDLDGRYPRTVNGQVPDSNGNIAVSLTSVSTGDSSSFPGTPAEGDVYVISGDANTALNGKSYIYDADGAQWLEVSNYDQASTDARYVNISGDTMTGDLSLPNDPTAPLHAATKQYVDAMVANNEVYTSNAVLDSATGILTQNRTDGTSYTVDVFAGLDGRYVNANGDTMNGDLIVNGDVTVNGQLIASNTTLTLGNLADVNDAAATTNGQVLTWDATAGEWKPLALPAGSVDTYVDTAAWDVNTTTLTLTRNDGNTITVTIPGVDQYVNAASFDSSNGELTLTMADGNTVVVDLDGRYLELTAGGTVTGNTIFNGNLQTPTVPASNNDVTNKLYVDNLIANSEVYTSNAVLDSATGILTQTRTDGTTYTVDIFAGLDGRYVNANGDTMNGNLILNGDITVNGQLIASNTTLKLGDLADVSNVAATDNQILSWDAANGEWMPITLPSGTIDTFVSGASFDTGNGELTLTRNDGNTVVVDLDGRYLELTAGGTVTGNTIFNGNLQTPTAPTSNNDVANKLYVDNLIANVDVHTSNAVLDSATGILTQTRTDGSTYTVDIFAGLDDRYVNANGDTMNGDLIVNGDVTVNGQLIASNTTLKLGDLADVSNVAPSDKEFLMWSAGSGEWIPSSVVAPNAADTYVNTASFDTSNGELTLTMNDGSTVVVDLDGRYLETPASANTNDVLTWDGANWVPLANPDTTVNTFTFDINTGNLVITDTAGSTFAVDIDGRYVRTVNGTVPDGNGNVTVSITGVTTGNNANRLAATAAEGDVWVVSGDTDPTLDGKAYIYDADSSAWYEISPPDQAANDARYVNITGDTMTGDLTLAGDPTAPLHAAPKQYVDALVANSEISINAFSFDLTNGNLVIQETDGTNWAVDLDGRYLEIPATATAGQILEYDGANWIVANNDHVTKIGDLTDVSNTAPTDGQVLAWDANNSLWVPISGGGVDKYVANGAFVANNTTAVLTLTYNDSTTTNIDLAHSITQHTDVDTITITPVANTSMLYWDGTNWVPTSVLDAGQTTADDF